MTRKLKTILYSAMSFFTIIGVATITSCNEDKCQAINCAFEGVCKDGQCQCTFGYEGTLCETPTVNKFKGNWQVDEDGTYTNPAQYSVSITETDQTNHVLIKNFYNNFKADIKAFVAGDTIYIPYQELEGKIVEGKGYVYDSKYYANHGQLIMNYSVFNGEFWDYFGTVNESKSSVWNK